MTGRSMTGRTTGSSTRPVLVLGGTGKTGRRVAAQLAQRGLEARVASRSTPQRFDWHDHATWAPAVDGVDSAYVVTAGAAPPLRAFGALAAARGVKRLVLLSARAWEATGDDDSCWPAGAPCGTSTASGRSCGRPGSRRTFSEEPFLW
jgi:hypothetical protein